VIVLGSALLSLSCGSSSEVATGPSPVKCAVQVRVQGSGFPPGGGSGTLDIAANRECSWSAQSDVAWLTITAPAAGQGAGRVAFAVAANAVPAPRTGQISIGDQRLQISQQAAACEVRPSPTRESVAPEGGIRTIRVTASHPQCGWTARADVPWMAIEGAGGGMGDGTVTIRIDHSDGRPRTGTITIGGQTVTIAQAPECRIAVEPETVGVPVSGGSGTIKVEASDDCEWMARSDDDWIELTGDTSVTGAGRVRFTVRASGGPARTGSIMVGNRSVTVSQGSGCAVVLRPDALNVGAGGGAADSVFVSAAAGCEWTATSQASWLAIASGAAGSGDGRIQLSIAPNTGPGRSGTVVVGTASVSVTQATGCTYGVTPATLEMPGAGGSATLSIATDAGCSWTAAPHAEWIGVSASSGTGPAQLQITAERSSSEPRSGTVSVAGQSITVEQDSPCTFVFAPASHSYDAAGGTGAILVNLIGVCDWTARSNDDWIRITEGQSGTGGGLIVFKVASNAGPARTGSLTIAGQRYVIRQLAP
jgi:hypothetical protein